MQINKSYGQTVRCHECGNHAVKIVYHQVATSGSFSLSVHINDCEYCRKQQNLFNYVDLPDPYMPKKVEEKVVVPDFDTPHLVPSDKIFEIEPIKITVPTKGITVDCGSVNGRNPGLFKYRLVDLETKKVITESVIPGNTTNNIAEYIAAYHGSVYVAENGLELDVYSDSQTALSWITKKHLKTNFKVTDQKQLTILEGAQLYFKGLKFNHRPKFWDTNKFGDIPADYGKKTPRKPTV